MAFPHSVSTQLDVPGGELELFHMAWRERTLSFRKALKTARSDYFSSLLEENKHNPRYLFNTVAKKKKKQHQLVLTFPNSTAVMTLMNYFTSKINNTRDQTVTMQLQYHIKCCTIDPLRNNSTHSLLSERKNCINLLNQLNH